MQDCLQVTFLASLSFLEHPLGSVLHSLEDGALVCCGVLSTHAKFIRLSLAAACCGSVFPDARGILHVASCQSSVLPVLILCTSVPWPPPEFSVLALWTLFQAEGHHKLEIWVFSQGHWFHFLSVAKPRIHVCSNLPELHCLGLPAGASRFPRAAVGTSLYS